MYFGPDRLRNETVFVWAEFPTKEVALRADLVPLMRKGPKTGRLILIAAAFGIFASFGIPPAYSSLSVTDYFLAPPEGTRQFEGNGSGVFFGFPVDFAIDATQTSSQGMVIHGVATSEVRTVATASGGLGLLPFAQTVTTSRYYSVGEAGLSLHREDIDDGQVDSSTVYDAPVLVLPTVFEIGQTHSGVQTYLVNGVLPGSASVMLNVVGLESLSIAGASMEAVRINISWVATDQTPAGVVPRYSEETWFLVKGAGFVKTRQVQSSALPATPENTSYDVTLTAIAAAGASSEPGGHPSLLGAVALGGGWKWSDWLGYFNDSGTPWILHTEHQWLFCAGTDPGNVWLWAPDLGWLWTSAMDYPNLYSEERGHWIWYLVGSVDPRQFVDLATEQWEYR